jgi:hypothetical protein
LPGLGHGQIWSTTGLKKKKRGKKNWKNDVYKKTDKKLLN